jgi:hypothetical protein
MMNSSPLLPHPLNRRESKSRRVHAVALPGRLRPVIEHVAQVGIAPCAKDLGPFREPAIIALGSVIVRFHLSNSRGTAEILTSRTDVFDMRLAAVTFFRGTG